MLLSQAGPDQQSAAMWILSSLGWIYLILLPLAALAAFLLSLLIVIRGRGPLAAAALLLVVLAPMLIGLFAGIQGIVNVYRVIAVAGGQPLRFSLASGVSTALVAPLVAMLLSVPAYATAALGALVRCLKAPAE
ncbi:hypothetical protein [Roseimaritima ulvae]|nr:hypothetical protein [Roseimaritima ulvae]